MLDLIKRIVPYRYKQNPLGPYNRLRRILGIAKFRYNALNKVLDDNEEIGRLFKEEEMRKHYAHEAMRQTLDFPTVYINQIRYYRLYKYFQTYYPDLFYKETRIIDVGDTSGILFKAMGKDGLSVNINNEAVEFIRQNGISADIQDAEALTYGNKSFDYAFCFQCLEHMKNPLRALDELGRVVKKKVFLSIPYVERTHIFDKNFSVNIKKLPVELGGYGQREEVKDFDCHVFEFSTKDMIRLLSFTRLEYVDSFPINYFKPLGTTHADQGSSFNFFILKPR